MAGASDPEFARVEAKPEEKLPTKRRRRWPCRGLIFLVALTIVLGIGRAMAPAWVRDYVNGVLDRNPLYDGRIGDIEIHLWRGAYSITDIRINKNHLQRPRFAVRRQAARSGDSMGCAARRLNCRPHRFERKGVETGGFLKVGEKSAEWKATAGVATLKKHLAQFIAVARGGHAKYEGRDIKEVHTGMKITNAEFDASVGDLKASLDKLNVPTEEQKELLAVVESTRVQVVGER